MGASLADPGVGPSLPGLRRREAGLPPVHPRAAARGREGPPTRAADGGAAPHASPRQADDRPRARDGTPNRQRAQVRDDDGHARDPVGRGAGAGGLGGRGAGHRPGRRAPGAGPALPPRLRPRDRPGVRALGRDLEPLGGRRRSRRSRARCCLFARRSATSGSSPRTSRRCELPRRSRRPRACCRAAMPSSSSSKQPSASCWCRARISVNGSGRPASGQARCSSTARSAEPGGGRNTRCGSSPGDASRGQRATRSRPRRAALPLPVDRPIEVVWSS